AATGVDEPVVPCFLGRFRPDHVRDKPGRGFQAIEKEHGRRTTEDDTSPDPRRERERRPRLAHCEDEEGELALLLSQRAKAGGAKVNQVQRSHPQRESGRAAAARGSSGGPAGWL